MYAMFAAKDRGRHRRYIRHNPVFSDVYFDKTGKFLELIPRVF